MWTRRRPVAAAVAADGGGLCESHQCGDPLGLLRERGERDHVGAGEVRLQVEVLRRVAGQAELAEDDQIRICVSGALGPPGDQLGVAVDVADGRIDLGERDLH